MAEYVVGLPEFADKLKKLNRPGWIDLREHPLAGVEEVDRYTYRVTLKGRYPQFVRPLPCVMPLYRGCLRSPAAFRAAATVENMLIGAFGAEGGSADLAATLGAAAAAAGATLTGPEIPGAALEALLFEDGAP